MLNDLILKVGVNYQLAVGEIDRNVKNDISNFGNTPIGKLIFMLLNVAGFLILLYTIVSVVRKAMQQGGVGPEVFKKILLSALLVFFCFFPSNVISVVQSIGNIISPATKTVDTTINDINK